MNSNSKQGWGGSWTDQKLDAFEAYVSSYLTIMHATRKKYEGWPREIIYFDGFAGSGSKNLSSENNTLNTLSDLLSEFGITINEQNLYKGSCERVVRMERKFDKYYFVDTEQKALEQLKNKLQSENIDINNCNFICGDVNQKIEKFIEAWNNQKTALILLDPFGMQVNWNTIEKMKDKRIDLWILVPSGVIINRLLDNKGELKHIELLERHLGMSKDEIKNYFYEEKTEQTLFGENNITEKKKNTIHKLAEKYVEKMKSIFKYVTEKPLELKNSKNVTIFHFVFASNNKAAYKIASQIIERKQKRI
ncbi:MAG: three-Cys-motif partner protein TcmP [Brevinematia bacterium]